MKADSKPRSRRGGTKSDYEAFCSPAGGWKDVDTDSLSVSASDATSGVSQMQFGPDVQTFNSWETYGTASLYLAPPGATAVYGRFKDNAGNVSQPVSATINLDATPPGGAVSINNGAAFANAITATLAVSATDGLSGISSMALSDDGTAWSDWQGFAATKSWPLASGPDGPRTVYARFRDAAQNVSPVYSDSIVLDTTPPTTPAPDDGLVGTIVTPTVTFQWPAASDVLSGVESYYWKADCGPETATTALTATTSLLPDGDHSFYVRARDQSGNYSPLGKHTFTIGATSLDPPDMYAPDSPTDRDKINVSGAGPPKTPIRLYLNCAYYGEIQSGSYGAWQFREVPLGLGENVLMASILDSEGGLSPLSLPAVVVRVRAYSAPPAQATASLLTPSGGTVATGSYAVQVPGGALAGEAQVVVTPYGAAGAPPAPGKQAVGVFASITALEKGTGAPAQLQKPVRISLGYDPQALGVLSPSELAVHYYHTDSSTWVALASQVDTANRKVTAEVSHFTEFALLAHLDLPVKVYLPLVVKSAGGW